MPEQTVSILAVLKDELSPGLKNVGKAVTGLRSAVGRLGQQFSFLTGTVSTFIGAFAGIQGIRRAIDLAEQQVQATTQLRFALEGVPRIYDEINKRADEFQARTTVGNEEFQRLAAFLSQSGVAAEDLGDATEATFQAAAALQKPVEAIARQLISVQATGIARGELKTALRDLSKEAIQGGEAFRVLGERFRGSAEALAETEFGQAQQEFNIINDLFEDIGRNLIELKTAFLEAAREGVQELVDAINAPAWRVFSEILKSLLRLIARNIPTILKLVAAFVAWKKAVFAVTTAILALKAAYAALVVVAATAKAILLSPWILLVAAIGAVIAAVLQLTGVIGSLADLFGGLADDSEALFEGVASGAISLGEALDVVANRFKILWLQVKRDFFEPIVRFWAAVLVRLDTGWRQVVLGLRIVFFKFIDRIADAFFAFVTLISRAIDKITNTFADAIGYIPGVSEEAANAVRTNLAAATDEGFTGLDAAINRAQTQFREVSQRGVEEMRGLTDQSQQVVDDYNNQIEQLAAKTAAILEKTNEAAVASADEAAEQSLTRRAQVAAEEASLARALSRIREDENEAGLERMRIQEEQALRDRLEAEELAADEFVAIRLATVQGDAAARREALQEQVDALQAQVEARQAAGDVTTDLLRKQIALEEQLQVLRFEEADAVRVVRDEAEALASTVATRAAEAQTIFNDRVREMTELFDKGIVNVEEFEKGVALAAISASLSIQGAKDELEALANFARDDMAPAFVEASEVVEEAWQETVDSVADTGDELAERSRSTWTSFSRDFRQRLVAPLTDLTNELARSLGDVLDGAADAGDAFENFGRAALRILLQLIQQWLIAKALGLPTFGAGANAGGLVQDSGLVFEHGGRVPGPNVNRDVVPARLTPGEFIVRKQAVDHYGPAALRALNNMTVPAGVFDGLRSGLSRYARGGFQVGGEVGQVATEGAARQGPAEAVVVANESTMDRLLAGGPNSMLRFIEANRSGIAGILGVSGT